MECYTSEQNECFQPMKLDKQNLTPALLSLQSTEQSGPEAIKINLIAWI